MSHSLDKRDFLLNWVQQINPYDFRWQYRFHKINRGHTLVSPVQN